MELELRAVFKYCFHFDEVKSAGDFVRYIKRCQIETTMPFNDYWIEPPPFETLPLRALLIGAAVTGVLAGAGLWFAVRGALGPFLASLLAITIFTVVAINIVGFAIRRGGDRPFPTAPDSDLKTILKALYLQRAFVDFAISEQGSSPAALSAAFGRFLAKHRLRADEPTQPPAVVGP
jgi:hypothetical protein